MDDDDGGLAFLLQGLRADMARDRASRDEHRDAFLAMAGAFEGMGDALSVLTAEVRALSAAFSGEAKPSGPSSLEQSLAAIAERLGRIDAGVAALARRP